MLTESDPVIRVVCLDEFDGSLSVFCVKVISGVRMSWSLIFKVYVSGNVSWEIVLLSPEDCCELFAECV